MTELEPSILRILNSTGKTIGTGFLISSTLAVTCAHVAINAGLDGENRIRVMFTGQKQLIFAIVVNEFLDLKHDIAILRLETTSEGIQPLRLGLAEHSRQGNSFHSFGYATAAGMQGIFANGSIDGYLREHQLVQLQSPQANHGMSGAPVWDEQRGVVIGMITKGHTELGRNENTTFATPVELILKACPEIQPNETCPYLGLESFSAETERFFFGRTALTEKLLTTLSRGCRFLAVFGPSGSGKSSVVRAGLLPALKKSQPSWAQIIIRPADDPFAQLTAAGLDLSNIPATKTILFIDQFEELFTCPDDIRELFIHKLGIALEKMQLILIIAVRDDFYSAFNAKAAPLAASSYKTVVDVPVTLERADLVAMIEQPAAAVGLVLEEGLTDVIIKDTTSDGAARSSILPLLEFALAQLWTRRRNYLLTHHAYQSINGIVGSLTYIADDTYMNLPKIDKPIAERLLTALVHLGDKSRGLPNTRRRRALTEFDEPTRRVIAHFVNCRLLVTNGESVELIHDVLVVEWVRLQLWIQNDRNSLRILETVSEAANAWFMASRQSDFLIHRGKRLQDALIFRLRLTAIENAYLDACSKMAKTENINVFNKLLYRLFGGKNKTSTEFEFKEQETSIEYDKPLKIFLCHSSKDKNSVRKLYNDLLRIGYEPWLDEEKLIGGQAWDMEIQKAVRDSDVVIVCLSNASINKQGYVQKEIKIALDAADLQPEGSIYIIPIRLESCSVPIRLQKWHWVNFFDERGYERLLRALSEKNKQLKNISH